MAKIDKSDTSLIVALDIGNLTTRFGLYAAQKLLAVWQCATRDTLTADEARLLLGGFLRNLPSNQTECLKSRCFADEGNLREAGRLLPHDGIVSSAVPGLSAVWVTALHAELGRKPLVVGPGLKTGLPMHYNDPAEIGPDRIADAVAARETYGYPVLVVDLGVSTNIMAIGQEGAFLGGLIASGLELSARALSQAAARLPVVEIAKPATVIGKNTRDAMQAGFVLGEAARIDGLIEMIWAELGYQTLVVITGTEAAAIAGLLTHETIIDDTLTLQGLRILYECNRKKL